MGTGRYSRPTMALAACSLPAPACKPTAPIPTPIPGLQLALLPRAWSSPSGLLWVLGDQTPDLCRDHLLIPRFPPREADSGHTGQGPVLGISRCGEKATAEATSNAAISICSLGHKLEGSVSRAMLSPPSPLCSWGPAHRSRQLRWQGALPGPNPGFFAVTSAWPS